MGIRRLQPLQALLLHLHWNYADFRGNMSLAHCRRHSLLLLLAATSQTSRVTRPALPWPVAALKIVADIQKGLDVQHHALTAFPSLHQRTKLALYCCNTRITYLEGAVPLRA